MTALEQGGPGPQGPQGPQGPAGPQGAAGPANVASTGFVSIANADGDATDPENEPPAVRVLAVNKGFAWVLACFEEPTNISVLLVRNLIGNNSHISNLAAADDDFDNEEDFGIAQVSAPNTMSRDGATSGGWTSIYGAAGGGTAQAGYGTVLNNPSDSDFGNPDCAGALHLLSL